MGQRQFSDGQSTMRYLREVCERVDELMNGAALKRAAAVLAIPAAGLLGGCDDLITPPVAAYGVPMPDDEIGLCDNDYDDDGDGLADCDDPDCAELERCLGCFDGFDNDGDGLADCNDASCADSEACGSCEDEVDDDGDGLIDCDDPDCAGTEACP